MHHRAEGEEEMPQKCRMIKNDSFHNIIYSFLTKLSSFKTILQHNYCGKKLLASIAVCLLLGMRQFGSMCSVSKGLKG